MTKTLSLITGIFFFYWHISAAPITVPPVAKLDTGGISCSAPFISVLLSSNGTASVRWSAESVPAVYQLQYHIATDTAWSATEQITVTRRDSNFFTLKNFSPCTKYEVRMRKVCAANQYSPWTLSKFLSGGCTPACFSPYGLSVNYADTTATFKWSTFTSDSVFTVQWKKNTDTLWQAASIKNVKAFKLNGLNTCTVYNFRVKTNCSATSSSEFSYKEFKTTGCVNPCPAPRQLFYSSSNSKTFVSWTSTSAGRYDLQYRISPDSNWVDTIISGNNYFNLPVTGNCDKYQVRVRSVCSSTLTATYLPLSDWSTVLSFTSQGCLTQCQAPSRINISTTSTGAYVSWDSAQGNNTKIYSLDWTTLSDTSKHNIVSGITKISSILNNLTPNTAYHVRVRIQCQNGNQGAWSSFINFKTMSSTPVCFKPLQYNVQTQDSTALFSWASASGTVRIVLWIVSSDSVFNKKITVTGKTYKTILPACKSYTARFKTQCNDTLSSEFTESINFRTGNCPLPCSKVFSVTTGKTDSSTAVISWTASTVAKFYIEYALATTIDINPTTPWQRDSSTTNSIILKNLKSCRSYLVRVLSVCTNGVSEPSTAKLFKTTGCIVPPANCNAPENVQTLVVQDTVVNISWSTVSGASRYEVLLSLSKDSTAAPKSTIAAQPKIILTGLKTCTYYKVAVRAICDTVPGKWSAVNTFLTGRCSKNVCAIPSLIAESSDTASISVKITDTGAVKYFIDYRDAADSVLGSASWKHDSTVNSVKTISGLRACHTYYVQATAACGFANSIPSASLKLNTLCAVSSVCDKLPTNLVATTNDTSVILSWSQGINDSSYNVRIRAISGSDTTWKILNSNHAGLTVNGLSHCTTYQWQVRTVCALNQPGAWSVAGTFTTSSCSLLVNNTSALIVENIILQDFSVAPNPATDYMEVGYTLKRKAELSINIFNWQGQIVNSKHLGVQEPAYYVQKYEDVISLPTGLYLISVNANGRVLTTQKWLKLE